MTVRRDAQLNRAQILSVALRELTANPSVSIDDIAQAAGVARRTFYGHFRNREALVEALIEIAADEVDRVAEEVGMMEGDPALTVARFTLGAWQLRERYRPLAMLTNRAVAAHAMEPRLHAARVRVAAVLERGQQSGQFATDVPPLTLAHMLEGLIFGAIDAVADGTIDGDAGGRAVTLVSLRAVGLSRLQAQRTLNRALRATAEAEPRPRPQPRPQPVR